MEIELKYSLSPGDAEKILQDHFVLEHACDTINIHYMHSIYYDTSNGILENAGGALRLRYEGKVPIENGSADDYVCCFKRKRFDKEGFSRRDEFETQASDIVSGIRGLLAKGAPAEILEPCLTEELCNTAEVVFERRYIPIRIGSTVIELAIDQGFFPGANRASVPLNELELELKDGCEQELLLFGTYLENTFHICPETRSKYARARAARCGK